MCCGVGCAVGCVLRGVLCGVWGSGVGGGWKGVWLDHIDRLVLCRAKRATRAKRAIVSEASGARIDT